MSGGQDPRHANSDALHQRLEQHSPPDVSITRDLMGYARTLARRGIRRDSDFGQAETAAYEATIRHETMDILERMIARIKRGEPIGKDHIEGLRRMDSLLTNDP